MAAPHAKNIDKKAIFVWDQSTESFIAWDNSVKLFDQSGLGLDTQEDTDDNKNRLLTYTKIQGAGSSESDVLKIAIENGAMSTAEGAVLLAGVSELSGTIRQRLLQTITASGYNYLRTYDQTLGSIFLKEGAGTISGANIIPVAAFQNSTGKASAPALDASGRIPTYLALLEKTEDSAHTSGDRGIPVWGRRIDAAASSAGSSGDYATFNFDSAGQQYSTMGASVGTIGLDTLFDDDADNTAQQLKASAGKLYSIHAMNINNADAFIQFFDLATGSVTVGTTTPKFVLHIPKGDATNYGHIDKEFIIPVTFATAITYAVTTTPTGAGDPTVGITLNGFYK